MWRYLKVKLHNFFHKIALQIVLENLYNVNVDIGILVTYVTKYQSVQALFNIYMKPLGMIFDRFRTRYRYVENT